MGDTLTKLVDVYESCGESLFDKVEEARQHGEGKTAQTKRLTAILRSRGVDRPMDETVRLLVDAYESIGEGLFVLCPVEKQEHTDEQKRRHAAGANRG
jgi:hypothetical protein